MRKFCVKRYCMTRKATIWTFSFVLGIAAATGAHAEFMRGPDGNPVMVDGSPVQITRLEAACGPALSRFCPELTIAPGQTRNEIICLKPYRSNLTSGCRSAIVAPVKN